MQLPYPYAYRRKLACISVVHATYLDRAEDPEDERLENDE